MYAFSALDQAHSSRASKKVKSGLQESMEVQIMKFLQMNEDKSYKLVEANGTLKTMQKIVGGLVERIYYLSDLEERNIDMWCNEEGKLIGMPGNYGVFDKRNGELIDLVVGPVCFTKTNEEGETLGLS
ncbi:DUF3846 domain-containing protein, partial [Ileibacterium valens]